MVFWRAKADSSEEPVAVLAAEEVLEAPAAEPVLEIVVAEEAPVEDLTPAAPPAEEAPSEPPKMTKLTDADVEAVKQEIVNELIDKLEQIEGAIVPEVVTAPYDPRFPTTNQSRHCFIRYNEFYKCKFERGSDDKRCQFYKRAYESLCPPDWVEEWEELRAQGLWFGKY
eukprot:gene10869-11022_t